MFQMHIAYSLELLVLGAGLVLIYFGVKQSSQILKVGGYILTIVTALNMLCTLYYSVLYWNQGYFQTPHGKQCSMMANKEDMMKGDMMKMMKGMSEQGKLPEAPAPTGDQAAEPDHSAHH